MSRLRLSVLAVVLMVSAVHPRVAPAQSPAQAPAKVDLTGKWLFSVTTDAGTGTPTITFKQRGDSLAGHYSSQVLGEAELKGALKGRALTFVVNVEVQGTKLAVTYNGTVQADDT
ncbi:MAG: hypothetical protein ABJE47_20050, partial [bacterium]